MKRNISFLLTLLFLASIVTLSGCKKDPADPKDHLAFMEEMTSIFEDNKDDCDALGEELSDFFDDNEDFMKEAEKSAKENEEAFKEHEEDYEKAWEEFQKAAGPAIEKCADNDKVKDALKKFEAHY